MEKARTTVDDPAHFSPPTQRRTSVVIRYRRISTRLFRNANLSTQLLRVVDGERVQFNQSSPKDRLR